MKSISAESISVSPQKVGCGLSEVSPHISPPPKGGGCSAGYTEYRRGVVSAEILPGVGEKQECGNRAAILALDLATITGWAIVYGGNVYESGVWDLGAERGAWHYGFLFQALYRKLDEHAKPGTQLAYELAHHRAGPATRIGVGLNATVLLFAARRDMEPPISVHTATLKKWAVGDGRAGKDQVKAWARVRLGREPIDDNEADAVAVGLWAERYRECFCRT